MKAQPEKIGRYPVVRLIGRGAMGSVYLARDTELDRDVAIKTVRISGGTSEEQESFFTRFRNEARAVGRLKHPSIVAIYDVGTDDAVGPYLVFEYVEGPTLKQLLRAKGPLDPNGLVTLAEQVGDALEIAHREGIIHRDIKPENLLVGRDGRTHLADFGVARVPDAALTGEGQFLGTPCYGAPETLRGGDYGPASDQFSFAGVLYEAATGVRAFPGEEAMAVAQRVIHDEPLKPSAAAVAGARVPPALDAVLMRGLAKRPSDRFGRIADLVAAVRAAYTEAGAISAVADTVPLMRMSATRIGRRSSAPEIVKKPLKWWPFAVAFGVGLVAIVQLAPSVPAEEVSSQSDPVVPDSNQRVVAPPGGASIKGVPAARDGAAGKVPTNDAGASAALHDASLKPVAPETLSGFEREERAKDAIERAQRALESGDKAKASMALDEAYRYDPELPDIEQLRRKL